MIKNLVDDSKAVGLFNRGKVSSEVSVEYSTMNLTGSHTVRDLWHQKVLGDFKQKFSTLVPAQGVVMVKISK